MFGFGKRKSDPPKPERARRSEESKQRKSQNMAQLGFLTGVGGDDGDIDNLMGNMDVGDEDLEEELAMLLDGKQPVAAPRRPKSSPVKPSGRGHHPSSGKRSGGSSAFDIDDGDEDLNDEDVDLDDPELEAELGDILGVPTTFTNKALDIPIDDDDEEEDSSEGAAPPPSMSGDELVNLLKERLDLYEKAKAAADSVGDSAKSRRFTRGLKTLKEMIPKAKAGRVIAESDIPPAVSIGVIKKDAQPQPPPPPPPVPPMDSPASSQATTPVTPPEVPPRPAPRPPPRAQVSIDSENVITSLPSPLIPTPVSITQPAPVPNEVTNTPDTSVAVPSEPPAPVEVTIDPAVEERIKEYKLAAVTLKRQGDVQGALKYLKLSKTLEAAAKSGELTSLGDYPPLETTPSASSDNSNAAASTPTPAAAQEAPPVAADPPASESAAPSAAEQVPVLGEDIFGAPPPPKTVMEALEQRLSKYKSEVEKATAASNSSKARRMGRIVKQYEEAITLYKKGKPVPFDELPTPPGFAPIPVGAPATPQAPPHPPPQQPGPSSSSSATPASETGGEGSPEKRPKSDSSAKPSPASGTSPSGASTISRSGKPNTKLTLQEKQLQTILLRQKQFREAALNAKKRGDVNQAREFLRTAKGFDKLIQVAQAGLPVDMATLPAPPEAVARLELEDADNFEVVSASDCIMPPGNTAEIFAKLEDDLKQQLKMCMRTRDHFKSIGDIASANRFESMAIESKKDLDALRLAMKKGGDLPKYHYENRIFSITECNTDIGEDEIEISVLRGINYKVSNPADVDTFVKVELPYPSADEVQTNKTHVVKDTNNPEYNATYKMSINRTARNFQRFVHRHGFKCEVWSKGGFLRSSTLIGTATVKLLPLETKCSLHDAFDILEGRKSVGKLEVRVKIREPVLTKQITQKKEKWLSIDRT